VEFSLIVKLLILYRSTNRKSEKRGLFMFSPGYRMWIFELCFGNWEILRN
jgi:hypothetical protein